ncbi:MAG: MBL fold metallo-hydrolase [Burkholderiales bacterium]|nr:MBL fold metallo-hydrolase [Burkholderiales bacterium]
MADPAALDYPFAALPATGTLLEVAPGVRWLRMGLPFELDHINLWLLEDAGGWTVVDTGIGDAPTRAAWAQIFDRGLEGRPLRRVIVTHYHPDHAGNAAWLCERFGVALWMTRGEFLTVHAIHAGMASYTPDAAAALYRTNGLDEARVAALSRRGDLFRKLVPEFPGSHRRLVEGGRLDIDGRAWRVIGGHGHSPEHAALYCEALNVLISGDMLLPKISTNVAVRPIDPDGDPLGMFLESIRRFLALPEDVLVLPSHGAPFRGAHARVAALEAHHAARLEELLAACAAAPKSAVDVLPVLFRRPLGDSQIFFAMGEAIAHLHHLQACGRVVRTRDAQGVARYAPLSARGRAAA